MTLWARARRRGARMPGGGRVLYGHRSTFSLLNPSRGSRLESKKQLLRPRESAYLQNQMFRAAACVPLAPREGARGGKEGHLFVGRVLRERVLRGGSCCSSATGHESASPHESRTDLSAGADVFLRVLVDEDVNPGVDDGGLQGGDTQPPVCELRESRLLFQLQHALITLVT